MPIYTPDLRSICLYDGSITKLVPQLLVDYQRCGLLSNAIIVLPILRITSAQLKPYLEKLNQSKMVEFQIQGNKQSREIISNLYLGILSRFPTEKEMKTAENYFQTSGLKQRNTIDIAWALLNNSEFLFRH